MYTLNHTLEEKVLEADGSYLDAQGLQPFVRYAQSFADRLDTYQNLRDRGAKLAIQALRQLAQTDPLVIQKHGSRCHYDMTEVLRYIALSVLRDDELFFKEQLMTWLDTILLAYKKHNQCLVAYRHLQDVINDSLPPANSSLIRPYLTAVIMTLRSHR